MRKLLALWCAILLAAPAIAFGAYNDVTLTTDTVLSVNSITVNVSGSSATIESITVNSTNFTVNIAAGSSFTVTAPSRNILSPVVPSGVTATETCDASTSKLEVSSASTNNTITITPQTALCAATAAASSGGGGGPPSLIGSSGGGGGGSPTPASTPAPPTPYAGGLSSAQVDSILGLLASFGADQASIDNVKLALAGQATAGSAASSAFSRDLKVGMTGDDVKALQIYLNTNGYQVAASGPGSSGNETTMFGNATKAALIKFQKANGISPAAGYFGPRTRAPL